MWKKARNRITPTMRKADTEEDEELSEKHGLMTKKRLQDNQSIIGAIRYKWRRVGSKTIS